MLAVTYIMQNGFLQRMDREAEFKKLFFKASHSFFDLVIASLESPKHHLRVGVMLLDALLDVGSMISDGVCNEINVFLLSGKLLTNLLIRGFKLFTQLRPLET